MKTFIVLYVCAKLFLSCDVTARALEDPEITPRESLSAIELLRHTVRRLREELPDMMEGASVKETVLSLTQPTAARWTKTAPHSVIMRALSPLKMNASTPSTK